MKFSRFVNILSWYSIEKILGIGYGLTISAMLARNLGPFGFGIFSYYQNAALLLSFIINLGLDGIASREISKREDSAAKIISSVIIFRLFGFAVYALVFFMFLKLNDTRNYILFFALLLFHFFRIFQSGRYYFESVHQISYISKWAILAKFPAFGFAYWSLINHSDLVYYYLSIDAMISGVGVIVTLHKIHPLFKGKISDFLKYGRLISKEGIPVTISLAMSGVYMQSDVIILKAYHGSSAAGIYSAAMGLITPIAFVPAIVVTIFSPILVKSYFRDKSDYQNQCKLISQGLVFVSLIFIFSALLFGNFLVNIMYGVKFTDSAFLFSYLSITTLFTFPAFLYCRILVIENKLKFELYKSILAALANVILNLFLVPRYGPVGAATASILALFSADFLAYAFSSETKHIFRIGYRSLGFLYIPDCLIWYKKFIQNEYK